MEKSGFYKDRRVLPRWRPISRTEPMELASHHNEAPKLEATDDALKFYYKKWQDNQTLENASEVVDQAIFSRNNALAVGPAQQLISAKNILPSVKKLAFSIIRSPHNIAVNDEQIVDHTSLNDVQAYVQKSIHDLRVRTIDEPRNAFLWLEIARLNSWAGHTRSAMLAMRRAYGAAPENRLILRAMAAFYANLGQPETAYKKIVGSDIVKSDPWIQAAEISLSGMVGKSTKFIREGRKNIESDNLSPKQLSELASAIATEELMSGKEKNAKSMFTKSLIDPTDNSLAQAMWAKEKVDINIREEKFLIARAYEARASLSFLHQNYEEAVKHCLLWAQDEPYSARPAMEGAYIYLAFMDKYQEAIELLEQGLISNPHENAFRNNAAIAYAKLAKLSEARKQFSYIEDTIQGDNPNPVSLATLGLIEFRAGHWDTGRDLYLQSVRASSKLKNADLVFRAKYHWLFEEIAAGTMAPDTIALCIGFLDKQETKFSRLITPSTKQLWIKMRGQMLEKLREYSISAPSLFNPSVFMQEPTEVSY